MAKRRRLAFDKPVWKDPLFWVAVVVSALLIGLQVWWSPRTSWLDWAGLALRGLVVWVLISTVLKIRRAVPRALKSGYDEADAKARSAPSGQSTGESIARTGGRTVGRALAAYKKSQSDKR